MSTCFLSLLLSPPLAFRHRLFRRRRRRRRRRRCRPSSLRLDTSHCIASLGHLSSRPPASIRSDAQFHAQLLHSHTHSSPINVRLASPTALLLYCPRTSVSSPAEALGTFPTPTADARVVAILLFSLLSLSPGHSAVASFQSRLCDTGTTAEPLNSNELERSRDGRHPCRFLRIVNGRANATRANMKQQ